MRSAPQMGRLVVQPETAPPLSQTLLRTEMTCLQPVSTGVILSRHVPPHTAADLIARLIIGHSMQLGQRVCALAAPQPEGHTQVRLAGQQQVV